MGMTLFNHVPLSYLMHYGQRGWAGGPLNLISIKIDAKVSVTLVLLLAASNYLHWPPSVSHTAIGPLGFPGSYLLILL